MTTTETNDEPNVNEDEIAKLIESQNKQLAKQIKLLDKVKGSERLQEFANSIDLARANQAKLNDEIEKTSLTSKLTNITQPCLFLYSKYDFVVPSKLGFDAFNTVNTSEKSIIIFDHSGHSPMSNEPSTYAPAIIAFVNKYK